MVLEITVAMEYISKSYTKQVPRRRQKWKGLYYGWILVVLKVTAAMEYVSKSYTKQVPRMRQQ